MCAMDAYSKSESTRCLRVGTDGKAVHPVAKDIAIAVHAGGPSRGTHAAARAAERARREHAQGQDDAAIRRASGRKRQLQEIIYEATRPCVALLVEPPRTTHPHGGHVAQYLRKNAGSFGSTGSVSFMFKKMGVFAWIPLVKDQDELELDLIDYGSKKWRQHREKGEPQLVIRGPSTISENSRKPWRSAASRRCR